MFSAKSKSELELENITEDLTELDLLAVTLVKELQSGQKNSYFEKMNLYELPFEWDIDEINCLPVQCRRQGYFLWAISVKFLQSTLPEVRAALTEPLTQRINIEIGGF